MSQQPAPSSWKQHECAWLCVRKEGVRAVSVHHDDRPLIWSAPHPHPSPSWVSILFQRRGGPESSWCPRTLCPAEWRPSSVGVPVPPCSPGLGVHTLVRFRTFLNLGERWSEDIRDAGAAKPGRHMSGAATQFISGDGTHTLQARGSEPRHGWTHAQLRSAEGAGGRQAGRLNARGFASTGAQGMRWMREAGTGVGLSQEGCLRN